MVLSGHSKVTPLQQSPECAEVTNIVTFLPTLTYEYRLVSKIWAIKIRCFFRKFKRTRNSFTSEMLIFDNFFSKWSQMKTNEDKDMKPTLKGHNYTKFSYRERSSLLSHSSLEYMYFKGRTEVEVGDLIFCREIFPYLESSLVEMTQVSSLSA